VSRGHAVALVALSLLLTSCDGHRAEPSLLPAPGSGTTQVARMDITTVVTLTASVQPSPTFVATAPESGVVTIPGAPPKLVHAGAVVATIAGRPVRAALDATVDRWLVQSGQRVPSGMPLVSLRYSGFGLAATVPPELAYRMYTHPGRGRAEITNGPGPFPCTVLNTGAADSNQPGIVCAAPREVRLFSGLTGLLALTTAERRNVLALPVQSVDGQAQSGEVVKIDPSGRRTTVAVGLGITDGVYVEITRGLHEGDRVMTVAPSLTGG
jgi:multidrug efflux pump subunit AcrA (membrane-fusion protein)